MTVLGWLCLALAALPLALIAVNLFFYNAPPPRTPGAPARVSVLIPARDEERNIGAAVRAALASEHVLEVIVLDDGSTDRTGEIVAGLADQDARVRLVSGAPLSRGWLGKPHACAQLGADARGDWLLFQDADVTLAPDAAARLAADAGTRGIDLVSGIPRQVTNTFGEKLTVPLIHFVLLGYLPMPGVRYSGRVEFGTGVGQLMLARAEAYRECGGHGAVRDRIHDGMALAQQFRVCGKRTDLVDLTPLATCRMYTGFADAWHGFAKNAHEGMGSPRGIVVWTALLLGGHVVPWLALPFAGPASALFWQAVILSLLGRFALTVRFRQGLLGALLHPVGVALTVAIQWYGLGRWLARRPVAWKGRVPS